jgi:exodeoxyribonuclease VII large subunit
LIITRGGGSIADLSAFDSQRICETIASCRLPVITGIGHEINTSVTDLAAHTFAKTPTAVAQFLIKRVENYKLALDEKGRRIIELSRALLDERQRYLREWGVRLQTESVNFFKDHTRQLIRCQECVRRVPLQRLQEKARKLAESGRRMSRTVQYEILPVRHTGLEQRVSTLKKILPLRIQQSRTKIQHVEKLVTLASPVNTLKRGFSITRTADGRILRSAAEADKGDIISSQLYDGTAVSQIQSGSKES